MQMTVREFISAIQDATKTLHPATPLTVGTLRHVMVKVSEKDLETAAMQDSNVEVDTRTELEKLQSTNSYLCGIVENAYRKKFGKTTVEAFGVGDLWFEKAVTALENSDAKLEGDNESLKVIITGLKEKRDFVLKTNINLGNKLEEVQKELQAYKENDSDQTAALHELGKAMAAVVGVIMMLDPGIKIGPTYTEDVLKKLTEHVTNLKTERDQFKSDMGVVKARAHGIVAMFRPDLKMEGYGNIHTLDFIRSLVKEQMESYEAHKNRIEELNTQMTAKNAALTDAAEQLRKMRKRETTEKLLKDLNDTLASQGNILRVMPVTEKFKIGDEVCNAQGKGLVTFKVQNVRTDCGRQQINMEGCTAWFYAEDFCKVVRKPAPCTFAVGDWAFKEGVPGAFRVEDVNVQSRKMRFTDCCGWHDMSEYTKN